MVVVGIARPLIDWPVRKRDLKGPTQDVLLATRGVLFQASPFILIDVGARIGGRAGRTEVGELQLEHHGLGIRILHRAPYTM